VCVHTYLTRVSLSVFLFLLFAYTLHFVGKVDVKFVRVFLENEEREKSDSRVMVCIFCCFTALTHNKHLDQESRDPIA